MTRTLPDDCVLARTAEGTRRMRDRAAGLPARLRSVLFLVDGSQSVQRILTRAGQLGPLLEGQLVELLELGLVEGISGCGAIAAPAKPRAPSDSARIAPILGAKMKLLDSLERLDRGAMTEHGSTLVEARSWRELATNARALALLIQRHAGPEVATRFWAEAKEILVACRQQEPQQEEA